MATILVVDDRAPNREFMTTLLGYSQHRVLGAVDGSEALDIARAERPDLVITDLLMPRMGGFELVKRMRADPLLASTPVIICTATYIFCARKKSERIEMARIHQLAKECGVEYLLGKPSEPEVILETVAKALGEVQAVPDLTGSNVIVFPPTNGSIEQLALPLPFNPVSNP